MAMTYLPHASDRIGTWLKREAGDSELVFLKLELLKHVKSVSCACSSHNFYWHYFSHSDIELFSSYFCLHGA